MQLQEFKAQGVDDLQLAGCIWHRDLASAHTIIQVAHGMAEHVGRYQPLAEFLTAHGYVVAGHDHRGHGRTAALNGKRGYFSDRHGWRKAVDDMAAVNKAIRGICGDLPVVLLGHSMGSMLVRSYLVRHGTGLQGIVLSGTAGDPGPLGAVGRLLATTEGFLRGATKPSPLLNLLSFGKFNSRFRPNRTAFDWLSRDHSEVDKYIADPDCGGVFSSGFFADLLAGMREINQESYYNLVPTNIPMLFMSGSMDPVGDFEKGVGAVIASMRQAGVKDLAVHLYPGARHEVFNETNRQEVFQDLLTWLSGHCTPRVP